MLAISKFVCARNPERTDFSYDGDVINVYEDKYEELMTQYRPVLSIGNDMQPVYDDTYKTVLERILDRFYEYEESYWDKED